MARWFILQRVSNKNHVGFPVGPSPTAGEELGRALQGFAQGEVDRLQLTDEDSHASVVIHLFLLAADAYEIGASASLGHNRTDRYLALAKDCIKSATALGWRA